MSATLTSGNATLASYRGAGEDVLTVPKVESDVESVAFEADPETGRDTVIITEAVTYEGLVPGTVYVLDGAIRDGESGSVLLGADGTKIEGAEASAELTPTEASGKIELTYRIDASALAGRDVVTCDILTRKSDGRIVAEWDGVAGGAAVRLAAASSTTVGTHTGMPCEPAWDEAGVTSVVSYRNLEVGKEYRPWSTPAPSRPSSSPLRSNSPSSTARYWGRRWPSRRACSSPSSSRRACPSPSSPCRTTAWCAATRSCRWRST